MAKTRRAFTRARASDPPRGVRGTGRPRAALQAMCPALMAGNALAVIGQALRASHGVEEFDGLSGYSLADGVAANQPRGRRAGSAGGVGRAGVGGPGAALGLVPRGRISG